MNPNENLYLLPAFEEGCRAARSCISRNISGDNINNPHPRDTSEWRAWNLGWNVTLRSEQP